MPEAHDTFAHADEHAAAWTAQYQEEPVLELTVLADHAAEQVAATDEKAEVMPEGAAVEAPHFATPDSSKHPTIETRALEGLEQLAPASMMAHGDAGNELAAS